MNVSLESLDAKLDALAKYVMSALDNQNNIKEFYSPKEFAQINRLNPDYVRQLCREKRLIHKRTNSGRGGKAEIRIPHAELLRFQAEGLLVQ
jgi:hypothetical protein